MQRPDAAPPASVSHIGSLCPVWDISERLQIRRTESVQQNLQPIVWVTEDDEACPVRHFQESSREILLELSQARYRRSRVHIPLVHVNELAVVTNKSLVTQDAALAPSGIRHLGSQRSKIVKLAGFNCQLNPPRDLIAHFMDFHFAVRTKQAKAWSVLRVIRVVLSVR